MEESLPLPRGRGKNKCFWTEEESEVLIEALVDLACDPMWKTQTGFKNNYMVELHKRISAKLPSFSKQVNPHIESKVKWLKNKYHAIVEMCSQSGCRWDYVKKKIKCDKRWYAKWIKEHKEAKGLWDLEFPHFDALEMVYNKDKPTIQAAEGFEDPTSLVAIKATEAAEQEESNEDDDRHSVTEPLQADTGSTSNSDKRKKPTSSRGKKPKKLKSSSPNSISTTEGQLEVIADKFLAVISEISAHFATVASIMANTDKREQTVVDRNNTVVNELLKLGLANEDIFAAATMLTAEPHKVNVFSQLPGEMKQQYILSLLYPARLRYPTSTFPSGPS